MVLDGVMKKGKRLFTVNFPSSVDRSIYGEQLVMIDGKQYRSWNPYRSKLAASLLKEYVPRKLTDDAMVLYLGAASGTTVSHVSDIACKGVVFAVEHSAVAAKKLLDVVEYRENIIPVYADANHPERYESIVPMVDFLYQDISQRNQADIFSRNIKRYLRRDGEAVIMVKARSIDVSIPPKKAYQRVENELVRDGLLIDKKFTLAPFDKDHGCFVVHQK
jgi:fibrillarin-like pre-rRNA processing protein